MVEVLEELGADRRLAVATSKPLAYTKPLCDHLGLTAHFAVIDGPSLAEIEPKTDTLRRALDGLGLRAWRRRADDRRPAATTSRPRTPTACAASACCGASGPRRNFGRPAPTRSSPSRPSSSCQC
jgi:beta-phosphoglucomutase-like phosphatase (HAD superfamily)